MATKITVVVGDSGANLNTAYLAIAELSTVRALEIVGSGFDDTGQEYFLILKYDDISGEDKE